MKLVYIAGPYRANTEYGVHKNIRMAEVWAVEVWRAGAVAVCPHLNCAYMGGLVPDETFLAGDLVLMHRCDAVFMVEGWRESFWARQERRGALEAGMPVFAVLDNLKDWLAKGDG